MSGRTLTDKARHHWGIFARVLAAALGGYALTTLLSFLLLADRGRCGMSAMILAGIASFALGLAAFTSLALAMDRHHEQMLGRRKAPPRQKLIFRIVGWLLLALSLRASILGWGWSLGSAIWLGLLTLSAITLILLLGWRPRAARWTGIAALAAGIILSGVLP